MFKKRMFNPSRGQGMSAKDGGLYIIGVCALKKIMIYRLFWNKIFLNGGVMTTVCIGMASSCLTIAGNLVLLVVIDRYYNGLTWSDRV